MSVNSSVSVSKKILSFQDTGYGIHMGLEHQAGRRECLGSRLFPSSLAVLPDEGLWTTSKALQDA